MLHIVLLTALTLTGSGRGGDGTRENPFDGTGIKLGIASEVPFFRVDSWNFSRRGDFCENAAPLFQMVGTEGRDPTLVFPRVRSGLARFDIRTRVDGQLVQGTFFVAPHPLGCRLVTSEPPVTVLDPSTTVQPPKPNCEVVQGRLETVLRRLRDLLSELGGGS